MRGNAALRRAPASAPVFAALGDETRLRIIARLSAEGPQSIVTLTEGSNVTRQAVAKHLRVLEGARLARSVRVGRESKWELSPRPLADARDYLDLVSKRWDEALDRLEAFVEGAQGE